MAENLLSAETSPYLLQHRHNPVHWRPWGPPALAEAKALGRPILLSVGYAACHWCHVMAQESFENSATAAVMNALFVNIKVDREERPDIDQIYMAALHALGEQGGWPLTMFLTPDGDPVWGGTYFPDTPRYGRPAFVDVLQSVAATFAEHPDRIEQNRSALLDHLSAAAETGRPSPTPAILDEASQIVAGLIDPVHGGVRGAPKFPQPAITGLLWRSADRQGIEAHRDAVLLTLRHIVQGGIYDHLAGGIARYSVDDRWLVPHFEKMLYDNALLLDRLVAAFLRTGDGLFRNRIEDTIGWLLDEMRTEGGFASSLDADSPGGEGAFYVWRPEEIAVVLGADAAVFCDAYDVTAGGNFEDGRSILNRLRTPNPGDPAWESRLDGQRQALLAARRRRPPPARDDKILPDWNGLAIAALANAGAALDRPEWISNAAGTFRFITESMAVDGRLRHSQRQGRLLGVGFASDYAALIRAAIALHQATFDETWLDHAVVLTQTLDRHFWDESAAAYRLTADDADALVVRPLPILDESIPSANALIATALARLALLTGNEAFGHRADTIIGGHIATARDVLGKAGLFCAFDQRLRGTSIVVVAPPGVDASDLVRAVRAGADDAVVLLVVPDGKNLPAAHPAHGKSAVGRRATAFVCRGRTCSLPVTEPAALKALLDPVSGR